MDEAKTSATTRAEAPRISREVGAGPLQVVEVHRAGVAEFYLTVTPPPGIRESAAAARALYQATARFIAEREATIFHEKLYGPGSLYQAIEGERRAALEGRGLEAGGDWTIVSGRPWEVGGVAGLQVRAASGGPMRISDIQPPAGGSGVAKERTGRAGRAVPTRCWGSGKVLEVAGARYLYLSAVTGLEERGRLPEGGEAQARQMFENARALLEANGSDFSHVVRTWIYLPHILQWYREFNAARTAAYERFGIFEESWSGVLPASTGIQGAGLGPAQCLMDLVAVEALTGENLTVRRINNPRQSEATSYGSSFSRAVEVTHGGVSRLYVSGTASINERGETVYVNDLEGQVFHTMMSVGTLLGLCGAGWQDVCMATAFFKKADHIPTFERVLRTLGVPGFPVVSTVADVCRPELLFELEATAVYVAKDT